MAGDFVSRLRHGVGRIGIAFQCEPYGPRGERQVMLGEYVEYAPKSGSTAIFECVLDEGVSRGNRRQADDLGREIILGVRVAVEHVALAAFLVVQDETHRHPGAARPCGLGPAPTISYEIARIGIVLSHFVLHGKGGWFGESAAITS